MQRQLSNVSVQSYQDYQPSRKYGPQYEPGGYAAAVQQRSNMTQREDAIKFELGRIKALQEERLHIQKKTFTKWVNSFLQKARMEVEDLFVDLGDGRRLLKLLEIISGERLPRPNTGRMRVHKIENVNKSLSFLHTKVRLESIGAEDIVDGNPRLILGLIWTIILRFQIQEIEIDVDEENESSEKKSAKDALLLWCQRKTSGYHGVHIHNFTDSWRDGLGFNALIHSHRPDLFRWADVAPQPAVDALNHAFDVAQRSLGIPPLLDAEDIDTARPDEKSVMTYVASYYHTFAKMKNEQKGGRRIANIIGQLMSLDARRAQYFTLASTLLEWIRARISDLTDRTFTNSLDGIQRLLLQFKQYRTVEKPPKYKERSEIEALYFSINTMQKSLVGEPWTPPEGTLPQDIQRAWQQLEQAEHARETALRTELLRQQRLEQLNYKFNTKSVLRQGYLKEMVQVLSDPRYGSNLAQVAATVKKHEAISADILARTERFEDLSAMASELVSENYHAADKVQATAADVAKKWDHLRALLEKHRVQLQALSSAADSLRAAAALRGEMKGLQTQFTSSDVGRHLPDVERLLQQHALAELQLHAVNEQLMRAARQAAAEPAAAQAGLPAALREIQDMYDSLVAAAKDRKARLEDARNLYQFLEDHDEEEGWVTEKQRQCRAEIAVKDLRGVNALRQQHVALLHELRARESVSQRQRHRAQSLIEAGHPKADEIARRVAAVSQQWDTLRELAASREQLLTHAAAAHQFNADINEVESWMSSVRPLLTTRDVGSDAAAALALRHRHRLLHEQIVARAEEVAALKEQSDTLQATEHLQLPETESASNEGEWVNESRLVATDVWQEEPVERLTHVTVTEQRAVPQVKALYAFTGQGISIAKGEVMFLMSKTNPDWWSVRTANKTDGFVPANYVREIEPRLVPVQVRRPEKVRSMQRVKKTVLVKQVVPVRRAPRRGPRAPPAPSARDAVERVTNTHEELMQLSEARRQQLEDAIKMFELLAECDDLHKWLRDKTRVLREPPSRDSHQARRNFEKFVSDLSAASSRLEAIAESVRRLEQSEHSAAATAQARLKDLTAQWQDLLKAKQEREETLEGANSVELFTRTCDEALEWMTEKQQQLDAVEWALQAGVADRARVNDLRALQRRHATLARELTPLQLQLAATQRLADQVSLQCPSERSHVMSRAATLADAWKKCSEGAGELGGRLDTAVARQLLASRCQLLPPWLQQVKEQLSQEPLAKDLATAEHLHKQHQELRDDIVAHRDEFAEAIELGKKLLSENPSLEDVAEKVKYLEDEQAAIEKAWSEKDSHIKQLVQLAAWNKEADHVDAASTNTLALSQINDHESSVDGVSALLKRQEEVEARLGAQEDRLRALVARADQMTAQPHYAKEHILARRDAVVQKRNAVKQAAAERRRELEASLTHHQFLESAEELRSWIQEKTRIANDPNYRDLANLERKIQKHEAFERELQANEKQLRNVESAGQSLQKMSGSTESVGPLLEQVREEWEQLLASSRHKGSRLRQARAQRDHKRALEDVKARLSGIERALAGAETANDMRSCKRLLAQHQQVQSELSSCIARCLALEAQGSELAAAGHFAADDIQADCRKLLDSARALQPKLDRREKELADCLVYQQLLADLASEREWIESRRTSAIIPLSTAPSPGAGGALQAAQAAKTRQVALLSQLQGRRGVVQGLVDRGRELAEKQPERREQIVSPCEGLSAAYDAALSACAARSGLLQWQLAAAELLAEAGEVEAWIAHKMAAMSSRTPRDASTATHLLARHKAVELEVDTYSGIVSAMASTAAELAAREPPAPAPAPAPAGPAAPPAPSGPALVRRVKAVEASLQALHSAATQRGQMLLHTVCRFEYLAESDELESWINEQHAAASSSDLGRDYEHLQILRSKFDELRHRVETGSERLACCEQLANKLLASDDTTQAEVASRQEELSVAWQALVEQMSVRGSKLQAAADIHRFHRDASDLLARMSHKQASLESEEPLDSLRLVSAAARRHQALHNDLLLLQAQAQVLVEEATRLQQLYPGSNTAALERRARELSRASAELSRANASRAERLARAQAEQAARSQMRDLVSWLSSLLSSLATPLSLPGAGGGARELEAAQRARSEHDALRAELDARDADIARLLREAEGEEELAPLAASLSSTRAAVGAACARRQVALDQRADLLCFLRDSAQLRAQAAARTPQVKEIPSNISVEEVQNELKKHEAFEKLLAAQDEKFEILKGHGEKLVAQNHVESKRITEELEDLEEKMAALRAASLSRGAALSRAALVAQFSREHADFKTWIDDKLAAAAADTRGEELNLEVKIKKLQKHQAFTLELSANRGRMREIQQLAARLGGDEEVARKVGELETAWGKLEAAADNLGRGLEEAKDILEFNQHLEKIEAWIRDKEMMVQANELGRDYEHCMQLLRKLDDLDTDMKVDEDRVRTAEALADKLMQKGPSQQASTVGQRRERCVQKWRALSGALVQYRAALQDALVIHSFDRDVEDTLSRCKQKASQLGPGERARELPGARELRRRQDALAAEAAAVRDKVQALRSAAADLANRHPEHAKRISAQVTTLEEAWSQLEALATERTKLLDQAVAQHKLEDDLKELELYVSEFGKRLANDELPASVTDAEVALQTHHDTKAEIDSRQKAITALTQEAEKMGAKEELKKIEDLGKSLHQAWLDRKEMLKQSHELQLLKEQARLTEDWLAEKEAFLNNDDLADSLDTVELLIQKHQEFSKVLHSQLDKVADLEKVGEELISAGHREKDYIRKRVDAVKQNAEAVKEKCVVRGSRLEQARQLQQFLSELQLERSWLAQQLLVAADTNYTELSNLQSKIQKHAAFEADLAASKGRIDDVIAQAEELIEAKHYAADEISKHLEELENLWTELQSTSATRRLRLQQAYAARTFLRAADDLDAWLDSLETELMADDHGRDLSAVSALLLRLSRLEQQAAAQKSAVSQLAATAARLTEARDHFMGDVVSKRAQDIVARYEQLQEPMKIRRENLQDTELLLRWSSDADEEAAWIRERAALVSAEDGGATLQEAQALLKKHLALEAEIIAREPAIQAIITSGEELSRRGQWTASAVEATARELPAAFRALQQTATDKTTSLRRRCEVLQVLSEISELESSLSERRSLLTGSKSGAAGAAGAAGASGGELPKSQEAALQQSRRLAAQQREMQHLQPALDKMAKAASAIVERGGPDGELVNERIDKLRADYEDLKLLFAKREQYLQQSLKFFKFQQECDSVSSWIGSQVGTAASEDYGLDVEHVECLQETFQRFLQQIQASEGRIESVCEMASALLEQGTLEPALVTQRVEDIRGLWEDLQELALARQEALAGARQVHEFDRWAEETAARARQRMSLLSAGSATSRRELAAARRQLQAAAGDKCAASEDLPKLQEEAERLGTLFPDAKEHVTSKLEEVKQAVKELEEKLQVCQQQLELAGQLQAYFSNYRQLLAWTSEMLARVTCGELASDVPAAERLIARHADLEEEMRAKEDSFTAFYDDGEKLISEGHFMREEISSALTTLRARHQQLTTSSDARRNIYRQHLDALVFKRDADSLDRWIESRLPLVRDSSLGDNVAHSEALLARHDTLLDAIACQQDKVRALTRTTLIEQAFKEQQEAEAEARRRSAEKMEAERLEHYRRREMQRIQEERRNEAREPDLKRSSITESEETLSPAPQFDRLPSNDSQVKRAESMSVSSTPKRTPSFTTRRRTQSFRRHARSQPHIDMQGGLERKLEFLSGGSRAPVRSWRHLHCVLCGQLLCFFRDPADVASNQAAAPPLSILHAVVAPAPDYTKRPHTFRLRLADGAALLLAAPSAAAAAEWSAKLAFHAALPPAQQLTPYAGPHSSSPARPGSSSSSAHSSPEVARRTQAEILQQHRNSTTPEKKPRNIESAVLPSLPPRQPPTEESDVQLRKPEAPPSPWGKTRFSNGRDLNTEFIRSQQQADHGAPPLPLSGPPDRPPTIPERAPSIPERGGDISTRGPPVPEKQSVTALVNSYQQRVSGNWKGDSNRNQAGRDSWNNNWQSVETSHFYTGGDVGSDQLLYVLHRIPTSRPASVAGSTGSPIDQRPASRSSGESELSVGGGKEKKDKKGVFGGLFSRKKRPQSHM